MRSTAARIAAALALIAITAVVLRLVDADLAVASLVLLLTVLVAGLLGVAPAAVSAVAGFLVLNWYFTPPHGSLKINHRDDVVALVVFVVAAAVIGWAVHRLDELRRTAQRREREARLRLDLTARLARDDVDTVLQSAVSALVDLFPLSGCRLATDGHAIERGRFDAGVASVRIDTPGLTLVGTPAEGRLTDADRELLEALVAGLATAVERARLEGEVRDVRIAAAVSQQRAGFISAVSHNLRTPLTAIKAAASTLLASWSRIEPEERRELVETIYDEGDRLERLVQNTLQLTRIRAGGLEPHFEEVDIADVVRLAVRRLKPIARKHLVRLSVDEGLTSVRTDVTMAEQILMNLLENALRFSPPGSAIVVSAARAGTGAWELRVADRGPGVPPGDRERIFEEFQSADGRPDRRGTGLGLAIVRALVTMQHGVVTYEDTPGGGATFVCRFPVAPA